MTVSPLAVSRRTCGCLVPRLRSDSRGDPAGWLVRAVHLHDLSATSVAGAAGEAGEGVGDATQRQVSGLHQVDPKPGHGAIQVGVREAGEVHSGKAGRVARSGGLCRAGVSGFRWRGRAGGGVARVKAETRWVAVLLGGVVHVGVGGVVALNANLPGGDVVPYQDGVVPCGGLVAECRIYRHQLRVVAGLPPLLKYAARMSPAPAPSGQVLVMAGISRARSSSRDGDVTGCAGAGPRLPQPPAPADGAARRGGAPSLNCWLDTRFGVCHGARGQRRLRRAVAYSWCLLVQWQAQPFSGAMCPSTRGRCPSWRP